MVAAAILACEIAFWVFLALGLLARYVLRRPRLGALLLLGSPAADVLLLALTAFDLRRGAEASTVHAVAAIYLGFTVAFGHQVVAAADRRFAHRFAGGPPPARKPGRGPARLAAEWRSFGRAALAWAIACGLLVLLALLGGGLGAERSRVLVETIPLLTLVLAVWFATGPVPALVTARGRPGQGGAGRAPTPGTWQDAAAAGGRVATLAATRSDQEEAPRSRWAPWWVYVLVLLAGNLLRQLLVPAGTLPPWAAGVVAVAVAGALAVLITAAARRRGSSG